jgi:hypothetical protein
MSVQKEVQHQETPSRQDIFAEVIRLQRIALEDSEEVIRKAALQKLVWVRSFERIR